MHDDKFFCDGCREMVSLYDKAHWLGQGTLCTHCVNNLDSCSVCFSVRVEEGMDLCDECLAEIIEEPRVGCSGVAHV